MAESPPDDNQNSMPDDPAAALPAYALGALDDEERSAVAAWLQADEARQRELASYQAVVDRMPLLVEERDPPPDLRRRLIAAAAVDLPAPAVAPAAPPPAQLAWYRRPGPWAAIAAVLLVTTLALGAWSAALGGQLAASRAQVAILQAQPRVTIHAVTGTPNAPNATGEVVYLPQQQAAFLTVSNLPPPAADRSYQVWFIQDGKPVSAGLLPTGPNQAAARLPADLGRYEAIAVSLEPAGGSPAPTGPIVVAGPLTPGDA
jgi:anti-sigma-K factor RskA